MEELLKAFNLDKEDETILSIITEKSEYAKSIEKNYSTFLLAQQDRGKVFFLFILTLNIIKSLYLIFSIRPTVIISTGAGCVLPFCIFGKIIGSKIVFIESFAKVTTPTITGRLIYKFADRFYIQWESLHKYYPKALYRGQIY